MQSGRSGSSFWPLSCKVLAKAYKDYTLQSHLQHPPFFFCTLPWVFSLSYLPWTALLGVIVSASLRTCAYSSLPAHEKTSSTFYPVRALVSKHLWMPWLFANSTALSNVISLWSSSSLLLPIRYTRTSSAACYLISFNQLLKLSKVSSRVMSYVRNTQWAPR